MSLNIKNETVHELVRKAARLTGKSQTSVVEEALRRFLDDLDRETRQARADELIAEIHAELAPLKGKIDLSTDFLYDENGLPA